MATIGHATKNKTGTGGTKFPVDEIKSKLDLLEVATSRLGYNLKRRGNKYQGDHGSVHTSKNSLCVTIYDTGGASSDQSWHCFHCRRGGDVLTLIGVHEFGEGYTGRGQEFRRVVELSAAWAGVDLEPLTEAEAATAEEKERVFSILTETARYWHRQLVEDFTDILDWVIENYGFTEEFIERKLIGFAAPKDDRKLLLKHLVRLGYTEDEAKAAAVVNRGGYGRFRGRVTFPYWASGQVRYFAARSTRLTPEDEHEKAKYQKLKVRDDDNLHISEFIKNDTFLGIDTLRQARKLKRVLITEGAPDQLAAEQAGEPSLSPVTVRFKNQDIPRIAGLVREVPRVYLCMDNEENQAGQLGALDTALGLERENATVYLIRLPRPAGTEKIDVCDFLRDRGRDAFVALYKKGLRLPHYRVRYMQEVADTPELDTESYIREIAGLAGVCRYGSIDQESLALELAGKLNIKVGLIRAIFKEVVPGARAGQGQDTEGFSTESEEYGGPGVEIPNLKIDSLEKIDSKPPVYLLHLKGVETPVNLSIADMLDFITFRNRVAAASNIILQHPLPPHKGVSKNDTWGRAIDSLLKNMVVVEAPEDADDNYPIRQKIKEFFYNTQHQTTDRQGLIELGKIWVDEKNSTYWVHGAEPIQAYLKKYLDKPLPNPELWACFKEIGGFYRTIWTKKARIRCWGIQLMPQNPLNDQEDEGAWQSSEPP